MTEPQGTVALDAVLTVPTVKPALVMAVVAAACVRFTTFGTATSGEPVETTKGTAAAGGGGRDDQGHGGAGSTLCSSRRVLTDNGARGDRCARRCGHRSDGQAG